MRQLLSFSLAFLTFASVCFAGIPPTRWYEDGVYIGSSAPGRVDCQSNITCAKNGNTVEIDVSAGSATDSDAIHDNVDGEIAAVADKATPVAADHLLIEDSAASNAKKDITIGSMEPALEGVMDLQDMQGAVTDAQVPNNITITETDPIAGAVNGIVKSNGSASFSAAGIDTSGTCGTGDVCGPGHTHPTTEISGVNAGTDLTADLEEEVTEGSLANSTILSADIKDGEIVNADINASAAIAYSKLAALTSANILVGNGSNVATVVDPSGDVDIDNSGVFAIQAGVIVNNDINASAAIAFSKLAALSSGNILVGNGSNVATSVAMSGDTTIDNAGAVTIGNDKVTYAKMQNVTATDKVIGRSTAGAGDPEEITFSDSAQDQAQDTWAANQVWVSSSTTAGTPRTITDMTAGVFGDGSDGSVTISADTELTRDMYYSSLTINSSVKLKTANYKIFVAGTATINGTLSGDVADANLYSAATNGSGATQGTGCYPGVMAADSADGNAIGNEYGADGGPGGAGVGNLSQWGAYTGGNGGSGGTGGAGGAGGNTSNDFDIKNTVRFLTMNFMGSGSLESEGINIAAAVLQGGNSGGGGGGGANGGGTGGAGGGGGCGGGAVLLYAKTITVAASGVITADGSNGGNGAAGVGGNASGGAGGGGGGGGFIYLVYQSYTNSGSVAAAAGNGGSGGAKVGSGTVGASGSNGSAGVIVKYNTLSGAHE